MPEIQRLVKDAFYPVPAAQGEATAPAKKAAPVPAASTVTADVYNGGCSRGWPEMSRRRWSRAVTRGDDRGRVRSGADRRARQPGLLRRGRAANAAIIAAEVGATAQPLVSLPAGQVEVLLGSSVTAAPAGLASAGPATAQLRGPRRAIADGPGRLVSGGGSTVAPNARYGIPCVY